MTRIRTINSKILRDEDLFEAEQLTELPLRLAYIGLCTCCDQAGRFRWCPKELSLDILPYDGVDFTSVLDALAYYEFIVKYRCDDQFYGCLPCHEHKRNSHHKPKSQLPAPETGVMTNTEDFLQTNEE